MIKNTLLVFSIVCMASCDKNSTESSNISSSSLISSLSGNSSIITQSSSDSKISSNISSSSYIKLQNGIYLTDSSSTDTASTMLSAYPFKIWYEISNDSIFRYSNGFTLSEITSSNDVHSLLLSQGSAFKMKFDQSLSEFDWANAEVRFAPTEKFVKNTLSVKFYFKNNFIIDKTYGRIQNFRKIR